MFIYTIRASTLRFLSVLLLSGLLLSGLTIYGMTATETAAEGIRYDSIRTESDRRALLSSLGFEVTADAETTAEFTLPDALDTVLLGYNELQKAQGLDIGKYTGKTVTRYTYLIPDYEGYDGKVYANIILYRHRVVALDLTGVGEESFVRELKR